MLVWYLDGPYLTLRCEILDGHLTGCWAADRSTPLTRSFYDPKLHA